MEELDSAFPQEDLPDRDEELRRVRAPLHVWLEAGRARVGYLARVVRSNSLGPLGLFSDQLIWLVVIRDVSILDLGPPGRPHRPFIGWLGVFVRTDVPRYIVAASF